MIETEIAHPRYPVEFRPVACQKRGCTMEMLEPYAGSPRWYQHGQNPEAVLELPTWELGIVRRSTYFWWLEEEIEGPVPSAALEDWVSRVHAYESGDA